MYSYYFEDKISNDSVNSLVEKLQAVGGKILLYFSTSGGYKDDMMYLIYFLNSRKEDITIIIMNRLASAGTLLFTEFKGEIKIDSGLDYVLFHAFDRESYSIRKYDVCDKILTEQDMSGNKIFAKKLKKKNIFTTKEVKQFLKGNNIILYKKDFKKLTKVK